jgi:hypothetical protein
MAQQPRFASKRTLAPQRAPGIYASTYTPELGAAICRRVAAGESLRTICRSDPAMPTGKTVWNWARAHKEFRLMKANALSVARARSLAAQRARDEARLAAMGTGRRVAWNAGRDGYCPEVAEAILERLIVGESLQAVCRDPDMPSLGTVYNWLRRHPTFVDDLRSVKAMVEDAMVELACADLPWIGERKSWPMLRRVVKATVRRARRLSLKRYAPAKGPRALRVMVADEGEAQVIYDSGPVQGDVGRP